MSLRLPNGDNAGYTSLPIPPRPNPNLIAKLWRARAPHRWQLDICDAEISPRQYQHHVLATMYFTSKSEARRAAIQHGARPWNYSDASHSFVDLASPWL